jgi:hypothetical protein
VGRRDRESQLGEDGLTARPAVGVFIDEQNERRESRLIGGAAPAARALPAI